ncbi:hypothetical protein IQ266_09655 [filamentous cyanobacterium LEGE 11480]|uniref:Uncharacterized protein n=1 Tax=Romeriopsis navalis LEGE 11480 TaxID=2777977 RepID=A0A928VK03_9CYAN|nr:hypothetical protein [Romeriopsis navalis]MBE9029991.1 hypothetical protein [Romeriopsis navalis LEGE 11480]
MQHEVLQRQSVRDCFAGFAWQGVNTAAPIIREITLKSSWKTASVQDFFGQYNWTGCAPIQPAISLDTEDLTSVSVRSPVKQFFDCFMWSGQPHIAPQPIPGNEHQVSPDRDFKLSNFADLF